MKYGLMPQMSSLEENAYKFWIKLEGVDLEWVNLTMMFFAMKKKGRLIIAVSKQKYSKEQAWNLKQS